MQNPEGGGAFIIIKNMILCFRVWESLWWWSMHAVKNDWHMNNWSLCPCVDLAGKDMIGEITIPLKTPRFRERVLAVGLLDELSE